MKTKLLIAVVLALNTFAFVGCNAVVKNADGTTTLDAGALASDAAAVRKAIEAQPPGPKRDALLRQYDQAATFAEILAILTTSPEVKAQVPALAVTRIQAAATQPTKRIISAPTVMPPGGSDQPGGGAIDVGEFGA